MKPRAAGAATVAGAALLLAASLVVPAGAAGDDAAREPSPPAVADDPGLSRLQVVESLGIAAVMGVITRVPAESPGGGAYTETQITPVKALGRAAGAYPGPLGEAFLGTSTELYENPSMVVAQQPPGLFPAEAQVEGGQSGPQGSVGLIRAAAASRSEVVAEVVMGAGPADAPFTVEGGVSRSYSRVEPDGTVVTEVHTTFGRAVVAGVLEMVGGGSRALARTPAGGTPTLELETTMGQMSLGGVGARLGDEGLVMADQPVASPAEVAQFNAGLAQLRQAGITVEAVPAQREESPGRGRISGAAGLFRYQLPTTPIPNSIGNDETFLFAQVSAAAVAVPRPLGEAPALPPLDLPGLTAPTDPPGDVAVPMAAAATTPPVGGPAALAPAGGGFDSGSRFGSGSFASGGTTTAPFVPAAGLGADGASVAAPSAPAGASDTGAFLGSRLALPASAERSLVASVTGFYAVLLFLGGTAVLILLGLHKARTN